MNNIELLEKKISDSGYKKKYIAEQLGLTYAGFQKKVKNTNDFTSTEIAKLCSLLNITSLTEKDKIFFAVCVD